MQKQTIWIGRWTVVVAIGHTLFGLAVFGKIVARMLERGVVNSVGADPGANLAMWFLMFGAVLALLGMAIHALERSGNVDAAARALGAGMLGLTVVGVMLVPQSGFWLCFPPAIGLLMRRIAPAPRPEMIQK